MRSERQNYVGNISKEHKSKIIRRAVLLDSLTYCSPPGCPFPIKSLALSACVSSDNSFPSVRKEPSFGPWKGSPFLQQMATLAGLFFAETDILTTQGTQGPACLPMDQTQRPQLGPFCPWSPPDADNWPVTGKEQETLLGKGTRVESRRVREPRRTALTEFFN